MFQLLRRAALLALCAVVSLAIDTRLSAEPTLSSVAPRTMVPGQTTEVTLSGKDLTDPLRIWTSFPATVEITPLASDAKTATSRVVKITPSGGLSTSIGAISVGTPAGPSGNQLMLVDTLAPQRDNGKNHDTETAQLLPGPCVVEGNTDSALSDYYRIAVKQGERLSAETLTARIRSGADPVLRLLTVDGHELTAADDDAGLGTAARFSWVADFDGEVLVEIRDSQYRAAGPYLLRLGDFPLINTPFPMGARVGATVAFELKNAEQDAVANRILRVTEAGRMFVSAAASGGSARAFAEAFASPFPEFIESEPNDDADNATPVVPPCALNGRFLEKNDRDCYRFVALEKQPLRFEAISRSVGSPAMVILQVMDAAGKKLAETAVNDQDEWSLEFTPPADGVYYLVAHDLLHRGGHPLTYRVLIKPDGDFSLAVKHDKATSLKFKSPKNGGFTVDLQCSRYRYTGPVQLELRPVGSTRQLPFRLVNDTIAAGATEHRLLITTTEGEAGDLTAFRIIGRAPLPTAIANSPDASAPLPKHAAHVVSTVPSLRAFDPQSPYPTSTVDGLLTASVVAPTAPFFEIKPPSEPVVLDAESGQATFDIAVQRTNAEYKDAPLLVADGLPDGFSLSFKQEKDIFHGTLKGPKETQGTFDFSIFAYGVFKGNAQIAKPTITVQLNR